MVRFCRSVGYDGLADFKRKLAGSVNEGVPFVHRAVDDDDNAADIVVKVTDNAVAALLRYRNAAAGHAFERAIAALAEAGRDGRRIEFYGVGNSGIVAQDAQHKFFRLGVNCAAISDGHVQVMSATMLKRGDCAVISNSGRSRDLLDVTEIALRKGATVIVITASGSPLALDGTGSASHPAGGRPPRGRRPLQPDGVAAAAPADHRHPDHRRGAAPGRCRAAADAAGDQEEPAAASATRDRSRLAATRSEQVSTP